LTSEKIVRLIDEFIDNHSYQKIAEILNERGYKSGTGRRFNSKLIGSIRANYDLKTRYARLRKAGKLTAREMANLLKVTTATVRKWGKWETLRAYPYNDRNECLYEHPGVDLPLMNKRPEPSSTEPFINS
jgi:DNA-binding transcriptional regulator YiaG